MISLKKVSKAFGRRKVFSDVSFQVHPGEFLCIIGPSGAGKSTLLHLLIGAEDVTGGSIEVDGVDLRHVPPPVMQLYRRRIGVVFQDYKLLQNRTVAENVAFPLEICGVSDVEITRTVGDVLTRLKLTDRGAAFPAELSGGEKARVAVARAIVHRPMVLLADEPTGNLDPEQSAMILKLFADIHRSGTTVILATHDAGLVDALHPRVLRLEKGRIVRDSVGSYGHDTPPVRGGESILQEDVDDGMIPPESAKRLRPHKEQRRVKITSIGT